MRTFSTSLLTVCLALAAIACGADKGVRLGAEGELCFEDLDCREALVCREGRCQSAAQSSPSPSGEDDSDGSASVQRVCSVFCALLDSCEFSMPETCLDACLDVAPGWSGEARGALTDCVSMASCDLDAIDACIGEAERSPPDDNPEYRFVLVEDVSVADLQSSSPGADIDAIGVEVDGVEFFAASVEDFDVGGSANENVNVAELLGPPDSNCLAEGLVSLGGAAVGGFAIVGFSNASAGEVTFRRGDRVVVYELGPSVCPRQSGWLDEPVRVGVSVATSQSNFVEVGVTGPGTNVLTIP